MTRLTIFMIVIFISSTLNSQERKDLSFSFSLGPSISFEYANPKPGNFVSFDMDYYFQTRHILSANLHDASHFIPPHNNFERAQSSVYYTTVSLLYKYRLINKANFSINAGAGWTKITHGIDTTIKMRDYAIPIRVESVFGLSKRMNASLIGGFFINYGVIAYYLGPRISYIFK